MFKFQKKYVVSFVEVALLIIYINQVRILLHGYLYRVKLRHINLCLRYDLHVVGNGHNVLCKVKW